MRKKIASLALVLAVLLCLTACGGKEDTAQLHRGTVSGNTYTSDSLKVKLALDDTWEIADDEQMAELSGFVVDSFDDEHLKEQLENGGVVYDLYAVNQTDGSSLNIGIQKLSAMSGLLATEDAFAEANIKQLPEQLAAGGITVDNIEKTTVEFAGKTHTALALSGSVQDIPLYETMALVKQGSYLYVITAATFYEDTSATLLDLFQAQ